MLWGLCDAMARTPDPWVGDAVQPSMNYGLAYRAFCATIYPRLKDIIEQIVASGLIYVCSNAADLKSAEIRPYLDKYVRGSNGIDAWSG